MSAGSEVAGCAQAAGFRGNVLTHIVAIAQRESNWDVNAVGDVGIEDAEWGPSVGWFQIRTLKAETGTGSDRDIQALTGNGARQAQAAWNISSAGTNFSPWSTNRGLTISPEATAAAQSPTPCGSAAAATAATGAASGFGSLIDQGILDVIKGPADAFATSLNAWLVEHAVRGTELVGGAILAAMGLLLILDVASIPGSGEGSGIVARGARAGRRLTEQAIALGAAAA